MEYTKNEHGVVQKHLDINLDALVTTLLKLEDSLQEQFGDSDLDDIMYEGHCLGARIFDKYELFGINDPEIQKVFRGIQDMFNTNFREPDKKYYMFAWFNIYGPNKDMPWHLHGDHNGHTFNGVFCVKGTKSATQYRRILEKGSRYNCFWHTPPNCVTENDEPCNIDKYTEGTYAEFDIPSSPGLLFMSQSDGMVHRAKPNEDLEDYRITIAFDITDNPTEVIPTNIIWSSI